MPHYSAQIGFVFNINLILSFFFSLLLGYASTLSPYLLCLYSQLKEFMEGGDFGYANIASQKGITLNIHSQAP